MIIVRGFGANQLLISRGLGLAFVALREIRAKLEERFLMFSSLEQGLNIRSQLEGRFNIKSLLEKGRLILSFLEEKFNIKAKLKDE